jgi:poly(beta-D-mannuronate) lyase
MLVLQTMNFKNYIFIFAASMLFASGAYAQTSVTTDTQLQTLVNAAPPGSVFIIPDGTYPDFYSSFTATGTAQNPIIIKAATVGGVILTGDSHFVFKKSAHIVLEGFVFDATSKNTLIKLEASNNIRITRNVFELTTTAAVKWLLVGGVYNDYTFQFMSHHNRIDHNTFKNKNTLGNYITLDGTYNEAQTENRQSQYDVIDHNYFYSNGPRLENENESIRIGNSKLSQSSGYTTVEFNLFEECDGDPEIVSVKSCDNIIRHNTFTRSYGSLTLRQGNRNRAEGNYFFGRGKAQGTFGTTPINTGGIRAYGTDHVIVNNYLEGLMGTKFDGPIVLTQGDAITGVGTDFSLHYRPERVTIAYNTLVNNASGIEIGYAKADNSYNIKVKDITIANNLVTGSQNSMVTYHKDQAGAVTWINNIMYPTGSATVVAGGPAFTIAQVKVQDPKLTLNGGMYKATATSPVIASGVSALNIVTDVDGQARPASSNAGADHYSTSPATYLPMTTATVGPMATEEVMALNAPNGIDDAGISVYPNPTQGSFELAIKSPLNELAVTIYSIRGQKISEGVYPVVFGKVQLQLNNQPSGMYIVKINAGNSSTAYKIIKQ